MGAVHAVPLLGLSQDLGGSVTSPRPRAQTMAGRLDELSKALAADGCLDAVIRVPNAVGDLRLRADLRARRTLTSVTVDAPRAGRVTSRVNWLIRQLGGAPDDLRVEVVYPNARETTGALLGQVREQPERLLYPPDPKREPRSFILTLARPMGSKRGKAEGSFVRETRGQTFDFYRDLIQRIKAWQAPAPKLHGEPRTKLANSGLAGLGTGTNLGFAVPYAEKRVRERPWDRGGPRWRRGRQEGVEGRRPRS